MKKSQIRMPLWGPYSKKYMGLSRIVDDRAAEGARYDFVVHPTLWNSATPVPNVTVPSGYHLWSCDEDFRFYSYRYELMWKDQIYADVSYTRLDEESYLMRCRFVNDTDLSQNCILNIFGALEFPAPEHCALQLPGDAALVDANDYTQYTYAKPRPWDNENPDGMHKGEFADGNFYHAHGLGDRCENYHVDFLGLEPFGCTAGDKVVYTLPSLRPTGATLLLRYRTVTPGAAAFTVNGVAAELPESDSLTFAALPYDGADTLTLESRGGAGVELDVLVLCRPGTEQEVSARTVLRDTKPQIEEEKVHGATRITLTYKDTEGCYSILTHNPKTRRRELDSGSLEDALINRLSNGDPTYDDLRETFSRSFRRKKSDEGYYYNAVMPSIFIDPHAEHIEYAVLSKGKVEPRTTEEYEQLYTAAKALATPVQFNREGQSVYRDLAGNTPDQLGISGVQARRECRTLHPRQALGQLLYLGQWRDRHRCAGVQPGEMPLHFRDLFVPAGEYGLCVSAPRLPGAYPVCAVSGTAAPYGGQGAPVCSVSADEAVL